MGSLIRADHPADDVLGALAALGEPAAGWWDVLGGVRAGGGVRLLLPRPGDPRGLALPRGLAAEAALGWASTEGSAWLIPVGEWGWHRIDAPPLAIAPPHPEEALRELRRAVVEAAHAADVLAVETGEDAGQVRRQQEDLVDSWVLGPPPLPATSRHLASLGLHMLLALDGAREIVDATALEYAARSAVESAFTATVHSG